MRLRGERGQVAPIVGLIILVFGGGMALLVSAAQKDVGAENRPEPLRAVTLDPIRDNAPPDNAFKRECVMKVAARYELTWSDGWTAAAYPRPTLSGSNAPAQIRADTEKKNTWEKDTRDRVALAAADWAYCLKDTDAPGSDVKPPDEDAQAAWTGTWYLAKDNPEPDEASSPCPIPKQMSVSFSSNPNGPATAHFSFSGAANAEANPAPMTGSPAGAYHYDMEDTSNRVAFADYRVAVDLVQESGKNVVAGRISNNGVEFPCSFTFHGHK